MISDNIFFSVLMKKILIFCYHSFQAAILQQTAEYIYQLEQEKTQLLSQNCQLKRLVNQHEGGDVPIKKRKAETQGELFCLIS